MVFPVVMYGCENWTIKKSEHWTIDTFELWCWRRLLRVPWTARRSNKSMLKEISPGCSSEGLMLKLKLQSFGHLMWRTDSSERTLMLGKVEDGRRRGWQRMRWLHVSGEFVISSILSSCNRNWSDGWTSVTAQFHSKVKENTASTCESMPTQKIRREERPPSPILTPLFMFFLLLLGLPFVNWATQEHCLFDLRSSLWSLDPPLFYFHRLFPSLSFSHHHSRLLFPILTT